MNNSKLVNVLRTFSKNEMKEFEKLISSPFFNKGRNYLPFFKEVKKFYPEFDNEKMTDEYIFFKLYPGKKFNKQIIWNMTSSVLNMAEEFLIHVSLKKNPFEKNRCVAGELFNRKLSGYFFKKLSEMEKALDRMEINDNYFSYKMLLEGDKSDYHFFEDNQHLIDNILSKKGGFTIVNFLKNISGIISDMNSNIFMFNAKFDFNLPYEFIRNLQLENIIEYARKKNYQYAPIMEMYYCYIMTVMKAQETVYFFRLKKLFEENYYKFDTEANHIWVNALSNYCSIKLTGGDHSNNFNKIQFEINKFQLEKGIAFPEQNPSKILFIQILKNALSVNETEWAKHYIEEYAPMLRAATHKPMRALGYAYLYLKLKDYGKVIENLGKVKFKDVRDKLNVRSLYIMTYYELNDIEMLLYQIDSARHFINKNPALSEAISKNYNIFLSNINKLLAAKQNYDDLEINLLRDTFDKDKILFFRDWLIEKIDEIKHIHK
ncbi:MAG TPA: hypothetical protein VGK25_07155 [Ignavibacteria bacterium]|jgi:hypothetical protein